jgi:hypothetical protein
LLFVGFKPYFGLGKGEVGCSNHLGSTIFPQQNQLFSKISFVGPLFENHALHDFA